MLLNRKARLAAFSVVLLISSMAPAPARAMDRDLRDVLVIGLYGAVAGTVLGLVSFPLTGQAKSIFIGSSAGLYLGLVAGVYYISYRDDPTNPLNPQNLPSARQDYEAPRSSMVAAQRPLIEFSYPVLHF